MTLYPGTKNSFILVISSLIIFWLITTLFFIDRWNRLLHFTSVQNELAGLRFNFSRYRDLTQLYSFNHDLTVQTEPMEGERIGRLYLDMLASLDLIENDPVFSANPSVIRKIRTARENLSEINLLLNEYESLKNQIGTFTSGILGRTRGILEDLKSIRSTDFFSQYYPVFTQFLINPDPVLLDDILDAWIIRKEQVLKSLPPSLLTSYGELTGDEVKTHCEEFIKGINQLSDIAHKTGSPGKGGITADLSINNFRIDSILSELKNTVDELQKLFINRLKKGLLLWLILAGGLFSLVIYSLSSSIHKRLKVIETAAGKLSKGIIPEEIEILRDDEISRIKENLNQLLISLREKAAFSDRIAEGDFNTGSMMAGKDDILGNSLLKLSGKLADTEKEEKQRKEEEKRRSWTSEGLAKFGDIFRSEREDVKELAYKVIFNLVKYLEASAGSIYLADQSNEEENEYELVAAFAWDRRKYMQKSFLTGEGLIGTCALEKETIFITEIPEDYLDISSGLTRMKPGCLLIVPLKLENEVFGVIEIAAIKVLQEFEVHFVEQMGEITATTLAAVKINERTSRLLEQSKKQTEEMQNQEERMKKNMEELQKAQEESLQKESEISGILNAVNSSSLLAEFSMNGRFADLNDKLQELFESPRDQIIGKHHSDFAVTNKYSDEYKQFWKDLKDGKTVHIIEKYRLYSGTEIWLDETFTTVLDNNGEPVKILNIAHDITSAKNQQEELIRQTGELKRRSSEMGSLSKAVDDSMIQCELSPEGIIISVNSNFVEITGYSKKELLGKNNRVFLKDIEKEQFEKIWTEVTKGKTYTGVIRRTKPTGEEAWLMGTFSPVIDEGGLIYKAYFLAQDITEKRLKYQLLEEANKEIERLKDHVNKLETK